MLTDITVKTSFCIQLIVIQRYVEHNYVTADVHADSVRIYDDLFNDFRAEWFQTIHNQLAITFH